jgi:hypothetical protein
MIVFTSDLFCQMQKTAVDVVTRSKLRPTLATILDTKDHGPDYAYRQARGTDYQRYQERRRAEARKRIVQENDIRAPLAENFKEIMQDGKSRYPDNGNQNTEGQLYDLRFT